VGFSLSTAGSAKATTVTYSTSASFTAGKDATGGGNSVTITDASVGAATSRTVTVTFTPQPAVDVNSPVVGSLGMFKVNASAVTGTPLDIPTAPNPTHFTLTIHETAPTTGTADFRATISGTVSFNSGFVEVRFDNTSAKIGDVTYGLVNLGGNGFPHNVKLLGPNATGGITDLQAMLQAGVVRGVPEPSSLALTALGAVGAVAYGWRRRRSLRADER
jgi:hypothetical protein